MPLDPLQTITIWDNDLSAWIAAGLIAALTLLALLILKRLLVRRRSFFARHPQTQANDMAARLAASTSLIFILVMAVFAGSRALTLPPKVDSFMTLAAEIFFFIQAGWWGVTLIGALVDRKMHESQVDDAGSLTTFSVVGLITKGVVWAVVLLLILDNIGVQVNTLIASLGIGGIAVGLAAQSILGDLFASLSIALDKPFVIGDYITVGDFSGTVEYVGLKSTRIRSLSGEQLIFSNSDLLSSRIRNLKRMERRRIAFSLGVTYNTPLENLQSIPGWVREIVSQQELATFDRCHFKEYGFSSINFETVYFVESSDVMLYMDIHQAINLALYECFEKEGIEFAYPTQTVFLRQTGEGDSSLTPPIPGFLG